MAFVHAIDPIAMRRMILTESQRVNVGHIGSSLSIVDILAALYGGVLHADAPDVSEPPQIENPTTPVAGAPPLP